MISLCHLFAKHVKRWKIFHLHEDCNFEHVLRLNNKVKLYNYKCSLSVISAHCLIKHQVPPVLKSIFKLKTLIPNMYLLILILKVNCLAVIVSICYANCNNRYNGYDRCNVYSKNYFRRNVPTKLIYYLKSSKIC